MLEQVSQGWPADEDGYALADYGYLVKKESFSASQHILGLYDHIRFTIFLLTTHYWEGRWLLDMQDLLPEIEKERKKTGRVGALEAMRSAVQRGVKVAIYTDLEFNRVDIPEKRQTLLSAVSILHREGIQVTLVDRVHSKALIGDDDLYCVGSFR